VQEIHLPQPRRSIRQPLLVYQERKSDAGLFAEKPGVVAISQPDRSQVGSFLFESLLVFAQLRDMLAAEDSSIVAKEDHDSGGLFPERSEPDVPAVRVGQDDSAECFAER